MAGRSTQCPSCGATVAFSAGASIISVCSHCESLVGRVGEDITELEILGKVAPLAALGSPLSIGLSGKHQRQEFRLVGRVQLDHGEGPWNEWYAAFDDGRWGWIAEAQGKVYLSFLISGERLPGYAQWRPGSQLTILGRRCVIIERKKARFVSAEGELPFRAVPGSTFRYCDFEGPNATFGTLDFGSDLEAPQIFLGQELEYQDLFDRSVLSAVAPAAVDQALALACPNCASPLSLRSPDDAHVVTCPACESALECKKGSPLFLLNSAKARKPEPTLPLGSVGDYRGQRYTIYGHLVRAAKVEGIEYIWEEYLLRGPRGEYRWLLASNGHFSFVSPVSAGRVDHQGSSVELAKQRYAHFQSSSARVVAIRGEFYWKVKVGDLSGMVDFVRPPRMLSMETTPDETTWSLSEYLTSDELRQMFKKARVGSRPVGIAPNQPNPHAEVLKPSMVRSAILSGAMLLASLLLGLSSDARTIFEEQYSLSSETFGASHSAGSPQPREPQVDLSEVLTIEDRQNLELTVWADVENTWFFLNTALINEGTNEVRSLGTEVAHYSGFEGGDSWSEGGKSTTQYLGGVLPGRYVLRFQPEFEPGTPRRPSVYKVRIKGDVFLPSHLLFGFLLLWILPMLGAIFYAIFEKKRWQESDHASE